MKITINVDENKVYTDEELANIARNGLAREQVKAELKAEFEAARQQDEPEPATELEKHIMRWKA